MKSLNRLGIGLLEVLLASILFVVIFVPLFGLYSSEGVGQQKMIRDYAVAMNIAENALNMVENSIEAGQIQAIDNQDITELILGNAAAQSAIRNLLGHDPSKEEAARSSVKYIPVFKLLLTIKPFNGNPQVQFVQLSFSWGRNAPGKEAEFQHKFVLSSLKSVQ